MAGGERFIHHLITPLGMNEKKSILEYGARIGSVTRAVAHDTGAWVSGFEPNPLLAEAAEQLSAAAGLAKKASVESIPLEKSDIREGSRDVALSFEALYTVEDKESPLKAMTRMLKPRGQLLITDFVRAIDQESSPDIEIWSAYEREPLHLVPVDWYTEYMKSLGLDIRVVEDMSPQYCDEIVHTLNAFRLSMDAKPVSDAFKPWVLWEVEYWAQRMAVLQSGDVALYRIHAILK
jgi:cyclopropane fatty-acyl-phospholipid synthase-like methyltransferase